MNRTAFKEFYSELLSLEYDVVWHKEKKPVWQWISQRELTVAPHFVGSEYEKSNTKIMVVGRAVNGWDVDYKKYTSLEASVEMALGQEDRFEDVVNENGIQYEDPNTGKLKKYFYTRSAFWRLIKQIAEVYGEQENWHQKIVWSNLYKVAPYVTGNPAWRLVQPQLQTYINCIQEEIKVCRPDKVIFVTTTDYLNPYPDSDISFIKSLGIVEKQVGEYILGSGEYEGAKLAVCVRPEKKSNEAVEQMAKDIYEILK